MTLLGCVAGLGVHIKIKLVLPLRRRLQLESRKDAIGVFRTRKLINLTQER
jgi:hypothetical protein